MLRALLLSVVFASLALAQSVERPTPSTRPMLTSLAELDRMIPKGVVPHGDEQWNDLKLSAAEDALAAAVGRTMQVTLVIDELHKDDDGHWIRGTPVDGTGWAVGIDARCQFVDALTMAKLTTGDRLTLEGMVNYVKLRTDRPPGAVLLDINLEHCRMTVPPARDGAAALQPVVPPVLKGADDLIQDVPTGVMPGKDEAWNAAKFRIANQAMIDHGRGRIMVVSGKVSRVEEVDKVLVVHTEDTNGDSYTVSFSFDVAQSEALKVARLKAGQIVTIEGTVRYAEFAFIPNLTPPTAELAIYLAGCRLMPDHD